MSTMTAGSRRTLDLVELATELQRMQETKVDYVADTRRVGFYSQERESGGTDSFLTIDGFDGAAEADIHTVGLRVRDHAHGQISTALEIPKRYYDRMRSDAPALLDANVKHWFIEQPKRRMLRTLDGEVRAYVSDRFRRLDNFDLMEQSIVPALAGIDGLEFQVASLTPETLNVRATLPRLQDEIKVGDIVQAGVAIRNSEVGAAKLTIDPFLWRLSCLNGMVSPVGGLAAMHVGGRIQESEAAYEVFRPETLAADDIAFFLKARDAIAAAVTDVSFQKIVAQLREIATGEKIADPVGATERLGKQFDLTETEGKSVLAFLASGGDLSQWGAVNAVTAAAKSATSFDRQDEMERIGGELAGLSAREWSKIAA